MKENKFWCYFHQRYHSYPVCPLDLNYIPTYEETKERAATMRAKDKEQRTEERHEARKNLGRHVIHPLDKGNKYKY